MALSSSTQSSGLIYRLTRRTLWVISWSETRTTDTQLIRCWITHGYKTLYQLRSSIHPEYSAETTVLSISINRLQTQKWSSIESCLPKSHSLYLVLAPQTVIRSSLRMVLRAHDLPSGTSRTTKTGNQNQSRKPNLKVPFSSIFLPANLLKGVCPRVISNGQSYLYSIIIL